MTDLKLVSRFIVPKEEGIAFEVRRNQVLRVIEIGGPQVVDFNAFALENFTERFCAGRTRAQVGVHPQEGDTLWSVSPYERVMFTIIKDTVKHQPSPQGGLAHDLLFSCCSRSVYEPYGLPDHPNCHRNITTAIAPFGLTTHDVHDAFNLFMKTGIHRDGTMFIEAPDAVKGDYADLRAEIDSLVALSACPSGDLQVTNGGSNKPVMIEVYELARG